MGSCADISEEIAATDAGQSVWRVYDPDVRRFVVQYRLVGFYQGNAVPS